MRTFACQSCGQPVYFENHTCTQCGAVLGFLPDELRLAALTERPDGTWTPIAPTEKLRRPGLLTRLFSCRPETPDARSHTTGAIASAPITRSTTSATG